MSDRRTVFIQIIHHQLKSGMKMVILVINLIILFLPLISSTLTIGSNKTTGITYTSKVGLARKGTPIRTIEVFQSIYCILECNNIDYCLSLNVISKGSSVIGFLCEFFDKSVFLSLDGKYLQRMEMSTYYDSLFTARYCLDIHQGSFIKNHNEVYPLFPSEDLLMKAVCDVETTSGGWTLLQRRFDGSVDFYRGWESYKTGFGDWNGEFWLGLENAHNLMKGRNTILRFDLWDGNDHYYQEYYMAMIASEAENYRLSFIETAGTALDSMSDRSKNEKFSTKDRDNDKLNYNCAISSNGAWWYSICHSANLNGIYGSTTYGKGLNWRTITGFHRSLSRTEIKIKRVS